MNPKKIKTLIATGIIVTLGLGLNATSTQASAPPFPTDIKTGLPGSLTTNIEPVEPYTPQTSCDPNEKIGITKFKTLVKTTFPAGTDWGSSRNCTDDGISEHLEGRAWDWHVDVNNPDEFAAAGNLLTWLTENNGAKARTLGIMYIGYNHKIWGAYRANEGWRHLNNTNPHTDHVHFSFTWNGATGNTSFWTGTTTPHDYGPCRLYLNQPAPLHTERNTKPCPTPTKLPDEYKTAKLLWRGSTGELVTTVQQKLNMGTQPAVFGPLTQTAVANFQRNRKLPITGAVDAPTWFALGMETLPKVTQKKRVLKYKMKGNDVERLQKTLRMSKKQQTGKFNNKTVAKVKQWQKQHRKKQTGKVSIKMQKQLRLIN